LQSSISLKDDRIGRLSTGGNISGRVSFAHAVLTNGKILQESTLPFQREIDLIENIYIEEQLYLLKKNKRNSIIFKHLMNKKKQHFFFWLFN
jgi:hypothetical protein